MQINFKFCCVFVMGIVAIAYQFSDSDKRQTESIKYSNELPLSKSIQNSTGQTTQSVSDPFKQFLDEKSTNVQINEKNQELQASSAPLPKDPFRAFLENQKITSSNQIASPFGEK